METYLVVRAEIEDRDHKKGILKVMVNNNPEHNLLYTMTYRQNSKPKKKPN